MGQSKFDRVVANYIYERLDSQLHERLVNGINFSIRSRLIDQSYTPLIRSVRMQFDRQIDGRLSVHLWRVIRETWR